MKSTQLCVRNGRNGRALTAPSQRPLATAGLSVAPQLFFGQAFLRLRAERSVSEPRLYLIDWKTHFVRVSALAMNPL